MAVPRNSVAINHMPSLQGKRVLIFGGLGLIGSSVARKCIALEAQVTIADNRMPQYGANDFNVADLSGRFELIIGDIREKSFVDLVVRDQDYIFNFAAQVDHNRSIEDPILDNQLNCIGHINVLMACKNHNTRAIVFYPGSRLQYGRITTLPVKESHPREPLSVYAIHKNTAEQYYHAFWKHYGVQSVCFRITNPYGPRSQMKHSGYSIINWFVRLAMENKPITVFGDGSQLRDYVFIEDLADGIVTAITTPACIGHIYNLGSGQGTKFIDMAKTVVGAVGQGNVISVPWPKKYDNFETGDFYADISSITSATGWKPTTSLAVGVKKTVVYYGKYREMYWTPE